MKKLLFMLLVILAAAASANANTGFKDGGNNGDKNGGDNNDNRNNSKTVNNNKPLRVEEFVLLFPRADAPERVDEAELEKAIVDLYKWYLQNESKVNAGDFLKSSGKELLFPFKVDPKVLQQYFLFVKKNFPGFSEDDLSNVKRSRKKEAVTVRDDMDNPLSISVNR
ncbi:hypothetical protein SAMN05444266_105102 [Chitinophaga jiangningensis]|uniref:Uncharacterized protein n=1 Tax=Chitinophaga jiangningensis TaxID=1419482 RepID=A0A1M7DRH0_9BACT|nr:hypothetical protein [Chitinophaga jiangningensis]SHL81998.1 hypothetical protein SAMN05444266_105102 [Chitinophaga jiangningensis]